ncbi:MAG: hypothetical protein M9899_06630 [Bdellovibrionaceae bacterium]|nr:hypothetical protein [Pseudobdellovibrionaceae bacterium]
MKKWTTHFTLLLVTAFALPQSYASAPSFELYQLESKVYLEETTDLLAGIISYERQIQQAHNSNMLGFMSGGGMGEDLFGEMEIFGSSLTQISSQKYARQYFDNGKTIFSSPIFYYDDLMLERFKTAKLNGDTQVSTFGEALEQLYAAQKEVQNITKKSAQILKVDDHEGRLYMIFSNISRGPQENDNGYLRIYDFFKGQFVTQAIELYNLYYVRSIDLGDHYIRVDIGYLTESGNHPSYFSLVDGSEVGWLSGMWSSAHINDNYRKSTVVNDQLKNHVLPLTSDTFITGEDQTISILDRKTLAVKEQLILNTLPQGHYSETVKRADRIHAVYPLRTQEDQEVYLVGTQKEVIFFLKKL